MCRVFALALGLTPLLGGCQGAANSSWAGPGQGGPKGGPGGPEQEKAALKVAVAKLEPRRLQRHYRTSGTLSPLREATLVATQLGIIETIGAEAGDQVKEGQVLARLDGRALALQAASATLQLGNLERELERLESVTKGAISAEEIDKQRYAVEEARAALQLSRHQAKQTVVRAPFSGKILERHVDIGNLATTATPLFEIADVSALELELHLPERDALTVRVGAPVALQLIDGTDFEGKVVRKAPRVDELTGTVTFTVRATDYPSAAMPGAFVRAEVLIDAKDDAPSIPKTAVFEVEGAPHVFVVAEGKARRTAVDVGLTGTDAIEITSGLQPGEVVVVDGNAGVTEGMPLQAAEAPADKAEPEGDEGAS